MFLKMEVVIFYSFEFGGGNASDYFTQVYVSIL